MTLQPVKQRFASSMNIAPWICKHPLFAAIVAEFVSGDPYMAERRLAHHNATCGQSDVGRVKDAMRAAASTLASDGDVLRSAGLAGQLSICYRFVILARAGRWLLASKVAAFHPPLANCFDATLGNLFNGVHLHV